jgi:hypothetical protein
MPAATYEIIATAKGHSIRCLLCKRISANPSDVKEHYCGDCHIFHDDYAQKLELARAEAAR